jgi:hypothetical protein
VNRLTKRLSSNLLSGLASQMVSTANPFQHERARSSSPFATTPQFHERSSRAMSPMLIPPLNQMQQDPPSNLRAEESTILAAQRSIPIDSKVLQSREAYSSFAVLSGSNYEYGGAVHHVMVRFLGSLCKPFLRCNLHVPATTRARHL